MDQVKVRVSCDCDGGTVQTPESRIYWEAQKDSGLSHHAWIKQHLEFDDFEEEVNCPVCAGTSWVEHWINLPDEMGIDIAKKQLEIKETCPRCGASCTKEEVDFIPYCKACTFLTDSEAAQNK